MERPRRKRKPELAPGQSIHVRWPENGRDYKATVRKVAAGKVKVVYRDESYEDLNLELASDRDRIVEGSGNGDPSCQVNNKSPTRPAYHGLALGVIGSGNATGTITVQVSSPGLTSASVEIEVKAQDPTAKDFSEKWCWTGPKW